MNALNNERTQPLVFPVKACLNIPRHFFMSDKVLQLIRKTCILEKEKSGALPTKFNKDK